MSKFIEQNKWVIVTFNQPVIYHRTPEEAYPLNPVRRYVLNADNLEGLMEFVQTVSDLKGSTYHHPLNLNFPLNDANILIERNRQRGLGDLLFMTGPMEFMRHLSAGSARLDMYGLTDRGMVLQNHAALRYGTVLCGPLMYEDLALYSYHWLVETATETNEEPDQLNVYDALYKDIGIDPAVVPFKYKRPTIYLNDSDWGHLDQFYRVIFDNTQIDLRRTPYYVVCPFSAATLRTMSYRTWVTIITELSGRRPVVVLGRMDNRIPASDMSAGDFSSKISEMPNVINGLGATGVRAMMAMIAKSSCFFGMDSGPLYIAQAARVPAISMWGSHDPGVRLGYDKDYMDLAVWNKPMCAYSPCYAYANFPAHKCPRGADQSMCEVLVTVNVDDVLDRLDQVEGKTIEKDHASNQKK